MLGRLQQLIDGGKVDDPAVIAYVSSLRERYAADPRDEITVAQLERLRDMLVEILAAVESSTDLSESHLLSGDPDGLE